ncbi:MAG: ATP-binding protein [Planctomycetota bacterium]
MLPTFRARLLLGTTLMVSAFVVAAALSLAHLVDDYFDRQVRREHRDAQQSFTTWSGMLTDSMQREVRELSRSPRLLAMAAIPGVDAATLADVLTELPSQIVAVLNADGVVLANRSGWLVGTDVSAWPEYSEHFEGETVAIWPHGDGFAVVGIAPLVQGGELLGTLICGQPVDDNMAQRIGTLAGRHVILTHACDAVIGCYWPEERSRGSARSPTNITLPPAGPPATAGHPATASSERWSGEPSSKGIATEICIGETAHGGLSIPLLNGSVHAFLANDLGPLTALRDRMYGMLLGIGIALLLAGILFATRTATRLSRPLQELAGTAEQLGKGNLAARVGTLRADRELIQLGSSFDAMADTLQQLVRDVQDKAERAEAANRAKDGFLTSISHEMRTPLTGIQSTAELLEQFGDEASSEERAEFLSTILTESKRLGQRISDALDYAALAGDSAEWTLAAVDVVAACRTASERLRSLQQLKPIAFEITATDAARIQGDRTRIVQAIEHLLRNAWQWSPEGGSVSVVVKSMDTAVHIEVLDRGPGLPADEQARVFETFTQGGDVLVDKPDGIGIGLQIVDEVASMHGGSISYREREGGGACFCLSLGLRERPIDEMAADAAAGAGTPPDAM